MDTDRLLSSSKRPATGTYPETENHDFFRFHLLVVLSTKMTWDIAPYSLVEMNRRFIVAYCCHHQDDNMKITVFWDKARCSLVEVEGCFEDAYCVHHQEDESGNGDSTHV
jgi:hypothetical protein